MLLNRRLVLTGSFVVLHTLIYIITAFILFYLLRIFLSIICSCLRVEYIDSSLRTVLKIAPYLAPYKIAVLPLHSKNTTFIELGWYRNNINNY